MRFELSQPMRFADRCFFIMIWPCANLTTLLDVPASPASRFAHELGRERWKEKMAGTLSERAP